MAELEGQKTAMTVWEGGGTTEGHTHNAPLWTKKHFSAWCFSTFIAQTNFTRGINMAETLDFYELLHSAGGNVREVMCSARLDLNNLDTEKVWKKKPKFFYY